ncbi:MAG: hypothetical protein KDB27_08315 [Planctomycetales bacterium]|nr:hypothetical protein [Planctomycetales bacterium]
MRFISRALAITLTLCLLSSGYAADKSVDLVGVWHATASTDSGDRELTWTFKEDGGKISGTSLDHESDDQRDLDRITVKDKAVTIEVDIEVDGNKGIIKIAVEEKSPGELVGKWSVEDRGGAQFLSGDITAKKEVEFAGKWDASATLPDGGTIDTELTLKGKNSSLKGKIVGNSNEIDIDTITVDEGNIKLEFEVEMDGNKLDVVVSAKAKDSSKLDGKWAVIGDDGNEAADGKWTAKRQPLNFAGEWTYVATVPGRDAYEGVLTLKSNNGKYAGTSKGNDTEGRELTSVTIDGKSITYTVTIEVEGIKGTITVESTLQDDGSLKGEWNLVDTDGTEVARDSWKATKK